VKHTISRIGILVIITAICLVGLATTLMVHCSIQNSKPEGVQLQSQTNTKHLYTLPTGDPVEGGGTPKKHCGLSYNKT
jgi:hypothetical protein